MPKRKERKNLKTRKGNHKNLENNDHKRHVVRFRISKESNKLFAHKIDQVILAISILFLFYLPLSYWNGISEPKVLPKVVLIYVFAGLSLSLSLIRTVIAKRESKTNSKVILFSILFILAQFISTVFSNSTIVSLIGNYGKWANSVALNLSLVIIFIVTSNTLSSLKLNPKDYKINDYVKWLKYAIYGSSFFISIFAIISNIDWTTLTLAKERASATLSNPLYLGFYLAIVISALIFESIAEDSRTLKILYITDLVIAFIALLMSQTRGSLFVLLASVAITAIIYAVNKTDKRLDLKLKKQVIHISLIILGMILATLLLPTTRQRISQIYTQPRQDNSLSIRAHEQIAGIKAATDHFLWGTGPEVSYTGYLKYRPKWLNNSDTEWIVKASNIRGQYVELLATSGIIGTIAIIVIIALYFRRAIRYKKYSKLESIAIIAGINTFLLHQLIYHQTQETAAIFWILLACFFVATEADEDGLLSDSKISISYTNPWVKYALKTIEVSISISIFCAVLFYVNRFVKADKIYTHAVQISDASVQSTYLREAIEANPLEQTYYRQLSYQEYQSLYQNPENTSLYPQIISDASRIYEISPKDPINLGFIGTMYYNMYLTTNSSQYLTEAIYYQQEAIKVEPNNPTAHDALGLTYLARRDYADASKEFNTAIDLKSDYWGSYLHRAEVYIQTNKSTEAIEDLEKVVQKSPDPLQIQLATTKLKEVRK